MSDQPISTASRMICSLFSSRETKMPSCPSTSARRMNCVANVVFPAPDAPITTVVEFRLNPPSRSGLSPKIPVRIFRTRAHRGGAYKNVHYRKSREGLRRDLLEERRQFRFRQSAAELPVLTRDDFAATEERERRHDLHRVRLPQWVVLVVEADDREPAVRPGGVGVERGPEPPAERAPGGPEHHDRRLGGTEDFALERLGV